MGNPNDFVIENGILKKYNGTGGDVVIPDGVTEISWFVFKGCTALTSVTIPDSVTSIGNRAFEYCTGLTSVTIPDSVTSIGSAAFENCTGLTSVTIPDSVTSIGSAAFEDCTGLTSVTIPDSVTSVGSDAFADTGYFNDPGNWQNGVLYIGNHLIKAKKSLSGNYEIRPGTVCIAESAFRSCTGLTSVTIPDSVTSIGESAFYGCTGLTSVTIPDSVTSIDGYAFCDCTGLTSVTIPNTVTSISYDSFKGCTKLTSVTIPDSVTNIGGSVFKGCTGLTAIKVDANNPEYSSDSFGVLYNKNKTELIQYSVGNTRTSFTIPDSVTSIGSWAFSGCTGLTSVTIPDSVTSIGYDSFSGCTALTSVTIPNSVTSIGDGAFCWCTELTSVTIPDSVTSIGNSAFSDCTGLTSVTIPDSVTSIGDDAFKHCFGLTNVTIPDSVTSIGDEAFALSHIKMFVYPKKKIKIGYYVFTDCVVDQSLIPLDVEWSLPAAFADFNIRNTSPQELAYVALFQSGASWKAFLNRQVKSDNINQVLSTFLVLSQKKKKLKKSVIDNLEAACSAAPKSVAPENAAAVYDLLSAQDPDTAKRIRMIPGLFDAPTKTDSGTEQSTEEPASEATTVFFGKTFVLTGLANESEVEKYIVSLGGVVRTSVSIKTDYLVYNAKYPYETKKLRDAKEYSQNGRLKKLTCAELKELLQRNGIVPDGCLDKAEELFDLSTPESSFREYKKTVSINMRGMESAQVDLRHSEIYREVVFDGELHKEQSKWVVEALSLYSLTDLWNEMTDCSDLRIFNGYSAQAPIAVLLAVRWFSNPDFCIKLRVYRDKWEERGDYPGFGDRVPPAVYWEINDRYPYGRWSCEQYDRATSSYVAEED